MSVTARWDPPLPSPRGPLTACLFDALSGRGGTLAACSSLVDDPLAGDDLHLALYACYELHYRGFADIDPGWEWEPGLLAFRRTLERAFEEALRDTFSRPDGAAGDVAEMLIAISEEPGPPLARYLRDQASVQEFEEYVVHRSAYQLKEADPHSWAIPRLEGKPKGALLEVLFDEFGGGRAERIHAELYRVAMEAMGLDGRYGAHLDLLPGTTLATVNLMSLFGLHRRLRAALVGHLAVAEFTSSIPNRYVGDGLRRLGYGREATEFFDEHVLADSVHDMIAVHDLAGSLAEQDPSLTTEIVFGASAWVGVDAAFGASLLDTWSRGETSLPRAAGSDVRLRRRPEVHQPM